MEVSAAAILFLLAGIALLLASIGAWLLVVLCIAISRGWLPVRLAVHAADLLTSLGLPAKLPLIPWSSRRAVPWGFIDYILLTAIWIGTSIAMQQTLEQWGFVHAGDKLENLSVRERTALMIGNILVSLTIVGVGLPLVALRAGATLSDFGWSARDALADLRLGCVGFLMLAPPVYGLQALLVQIWKPSKHPLIEMFKGAPHPLVFVLLFVSAVLVAPIFEELIFRVWNQGILEKWFSFSVKLRELLLGNDRQPIDEARARSDARAVATPDAYDCDRSVSEVLHDDNNPYASPRINEGVITAERANDQYIQPELRGVWSWLPILISSAIFALLHYSHGPDWIPLFLLAAGMGYLYQRTHRLLPSLIVHTLLNAFSLWGLWIQVQAGGG